MPRGSGNTCWQGQVLSGCTFDGGDTHMVMRPGALSYRTGHSRHTLTFKKRGDIMALIGTVSGLAAAALAFSIYWAAALAPSNSAPAAWPFIVAFVGAVVLAAVTSYTLARERGHSSMAPLVVALIVTAVSFGGGAGGNVIGWLGLLAMPLGTMALWAFSAVAVRDLRAFREHSIAD